MSRREDYSAPNVPSGFSVARKPPAPAGQAKARRLNMLRAAGRRQEYGIESPRIVVFRTYNALTPSLNQPPRVGLLVSDDGEVARVRTVLRGRTYHKKSLNVPSEHVVRDATARERTLGYVVDPIAKLGAG